MLRCDQDIRTYPEYHTYNHLPGHYLSCVCVHGHHTYVSVSFISEALFVILHSTCVSSHSLVNDRSVSRLGWDGERR